jgi:tetratricopeptide (TPR) repeat protein
MNEQFKYRAFISYSHADEEWARWLHKALETYRVPKHLVGRDTPFGPVPERLAPIFRDREELATATSLGQILTRALEQSAFQLVICSRKAAQSRWVNEEIKTYKRLGREQRIFALVVDGEPGSPDQECFPEALSFRIGEDGQLTRERTEPMAADGRPGKDSKGDVKLKLIAGMLGVGLDELKRREAHRRHRRMMWLVAASVTGMAITSTLAGAAWFARNEAQRQSVRAESEAETARQTTRFMLDLFKVSDPSEARGNSITAREILDKGAARIDRELAGQPAIQATLMDTMGTVYTSLGLYDAAIPLVRKAFTRREELWGMAHPEVATSLNHLGKVLTLKSDYEEAEQRLRQALAIRTQVHGKDSPEVAETLGLLAEVLDYEGEYAQSEQLIREALRVQRKLHGTKAHPDVAKSIEQLGLNYYQRGEHDKAVAQLREALAMQKKLHPTAHPALAQSIDNLAFALSQLSQPDEAESLMRSALAMKRELYGEVHPETAMSLNNLAYALESRGNFIEAELMYRGALEVNRKLLGASHPTIALNLSNIAFVEYVKGARRSAITTLRESLDMSRRELGPNHPEVGGRASGLAYWLTEDGKYDEAALLVDEGLAIRRKALGAEHPLVGGTLTVKANLMLATQRYDEARALASEARRILSASMPANSWQVAAAMNAEGAAQAALGHFEQAEPLLVDSLTALGRAPIPGLESRGKQRLVELYEAWGKLEQARKARLALASSK